MANALLSSMSEHWVTPVHIIEAARNCMGSIDTDPATSLTAQRHVVQAGTYMTAGYDGLQMPWEGHVWLNPPGGSAPPGLHSKSQQVVWWAELLRRFYAEEIASSCFLSFAAGSFLQSVQKSREFQGIMWPLDYAHCFLADRLKFSLPLDAVIDRWEAVGDGPVAAKERVKLEAMALRADDNGLIPGDQPTHANLIVGLGVDFERFHAAFSPFGICRPGVAYRDGAPKY